jgi:hypothetical protein
MYKVLSIVLFPCISAAFCLPQWRSKYVEQQPDGSLVYHPDEQGNILPDFSKVGYKTGNVAIPDVAVVKTVTPGADATQRIQQAIDEVSAMPLNQNGFRGAVLLKKGVYPVSGSIYISTSGVVLRGEGDATILVAKGSDKRALIQVSGNGNVKEVKGTRTEVTDSYVPAGSFTVTVASAKNLKAGDPIILEWGATQKWIEDLKMDKIIERQGTRQWQAKDYRFLFQRKIVKIEGNKIMMENPVVMEMQPGYNTASVYKYSFDGRIEHTAVENLRCESEFSSDTAEDHSWTAVQFNKVENGWIRNVSARYFAFGCVNLGKLSKNISVLDCICTDHKSVITGGRRYSFNNDGQQNLFMNCIARDGRHDYVTGAQTCGPNVFYNCAASVTHSDIGPHHRWSMGALYDNIITDGEMNVRDRGNWGSGHGWAGVNQVFWNCTAGKAAVESPWVGGKNYAIGLKGEKVPGRFPNRPDGEWEGQNQKELYPASLYMAQMKARTLKGM